MAEKEARVRERDDEGGVGVGTEYLGAPAVY